MAPPRSRITDAALWASVVIPEAPPTPSGGTITDSGGYRYHTFTSDDTLVWAGPAKTCDYIVVGGGGAAGGGVSFVRHDNGGGGGQTVTGTISISSDQAVTIGDGGVFLNTSHNGTAGQNGGASSLGAIATAPGGEGGGTDAGKAGGDSGHNGTPSDGGTGGTGFGSGGGAGGGVTAGANEQDGALQNAGRGYQWYDGNWYGAGGVGKNNAGTPGVMRDGTGASADSNGAPNTGQGGPANGTDGGSGVVIVRYPI